jgi:hypothetical protein
MKSFSDISVSDQEKDNGWKCLIVDMWR